MGGNSDRWLLAQEYEKSWWDKRSNAIDFVFYKNFAQELLDFGRDELTIKDDTAILEVGSGAGGILTYLTDSKYRYAIDPLEDYYSSVEIFSNQRDPSVKYFTAKGEHLPFEDNKFDLVIMDNVLDHCDSPPKVMTEIKRVIKEKGTIYFKQNTYNIWGKSVRFIMERFLIDKGHPYTFTKKDLKTLLEKNEFTIIKRARNGYFPTWKKELSSPGAKEKIKAFLLVTRDKVTYLLKNA